MDRETQKKDHKECMKRIWEAKMCNKTVIPE